MILDVYNLSVCVWGGGYGVYVPHVYEMEQSRNLCFRESFSRESETDWVLWTLCCGVAMFCTWTHLSSSYKIQRNNIGLRKTACLCTWGKFCTKIYKKIKKKKQKQTNPTKTAISEEPGAKTEYHTCALRSVPQRGGQTV